MTSWALLLLLFTAVYANIPKHKTDDQIAVYVNKVGPSGNPHETYHYYELPFCRPENIVHKSLTLGQVMEGDRMAESSFVIKFGQNTSKTTLCGRRNVTRTEIKRLVSAIERDYFFELFLDDIKVRQKIGVVEETRVLFPHSHKILEVKVLVGDRQEINQKSEQFQLDLQYTVVWNTTDQPDSDRRIVLKNRFPKKASQVHGLSIAASGLTIILILACILGFINNALNRDIATGTSSEDLFSETGWKVIRSEVFRGPSWLMLHCAAIGVGCQFCIIFVALVVLGLSGILDVHYHGTLNCVSVVMFSLTSGIAGFVSAAKYAELGGRRWVAHANMTSTLFAGPMMIIWALNNTVFWSYQTTRALPWTTVIVLLSIWIVFGYPLTIIGGIIGRHFGVSYNAPCRSRIIPREIPSYGLSSPLLDCFLGGAIPFTSIIVEMPYAFQILWGRAHLEVDFLVLLAVLVLIVSVACNSVALTYVQLNNEDYRWWWRSFFQGASIGVFIFAYGIYFYVYVSNMSGFVQLFEFFSHLLLLSFIVSLACGSVAHIASRSFVWYMYNSLKSD